VPFVLDTFLAAGNLCASRAANTIVARGAGASPVSSDWDGSLRPSMSPRW
jgi:hypothetical protein